MGSTNRLALILYAILIFNPLGNSAKLLGEVKKVDALLGGKVAMPCDVTIKEPDDSLLMLVWYKASKPFYSYDGRLMKHWRSGEFPKSERLVFTFHSEPAALLMDKVTEEDGGIYRCRADFSKSPTRNSGIDLHVIVLPSKPFFMDEIGMKVEKSIGPFHEGDNLLLVCLSIGGKPTPKLTWWKSATLLDNTDEPSEVPNVRENQLLLTLSREYAGAEVQCLASNTDLTAPLSSTLVIELYVSPETVSIFSSKQALTAGKLYELPCYVNGSRPLPEISWWLDGRIITNQHIVTEATKDDIMSTLHLTPSVEHNGKDLTCIATNSVMAPSHASKLHTIRLNIFFPPIVSLILIPQKLDNNAIIEGDVIQLRCMVEANPWISNTEWFANNRSIRGSPFNGSEIHLSSNDLLVLNVSSQHSGNYTCMAFNLEGSGISNILEINVLFAPRCLFNETSIPNKIPSVSCPIECLPSAHKFYWRVENGNDSILKENNIIVRENNTLNLDDIQNITDVTSREVLMFCWASNLVGIQRDPCLIELKYTWRIPDPPHDCRVNASSNTFIVSCTPGTNKSQDEYFGLSIWQNINYSKILLNNITSPLSSIKIGNLQEGQSYEVQIYSFNNQGQSEAIRLYADTQNSSYEMDNTYKEADIGLWSGVVVGILITLAILVSLCIVKKKTKTLISHSITQKGKDTKSKGSEKPGFRIAANPDITEKPLLFKNSKGINQQIVITRNNSEPKIIEELNIVQNNDGVPNPPSINRHNKPRLAFENGHADDNLVITKSRNSFQYNKRRKKDINESNGVAIGMDVMHEADFDQSSFQRNSMSRESVV